MRILFRVFGVLDLLAASSLVLFEFAVIPYYVLAPFGFDLIVKTVVFWGDTASLIDAMIAVYLFLTPLLGFWPISIVLATYLTQKGLLSLP